MSIARTYTVTVRTSGKPNATVWTQRVIAKSNRDATFAAIRHTRKQHELPESQTLFAEARLSDDNKIGDRA